MDKPLGRIIEHNIIVFQKLTLHRRKDQIVVIGQSKRHKNSHVAGIDNYFYEIVPPCKFLYYTAPH